MKRWVLMGAALMALGIAGILLASEASPPAWSETAVRTKVLHFPKDQCLGDVYIESELDPGRPDPTMMTLFRQDRDTGLDTSESVGMARGDVVVPAGRPVGLAVSLKLRQEDQSGVHEWCAPLVGKLIRMGPDDLSGLSELAPDDLCWLSVGSLASMTHVEERVLKPIARLTSLQILKLSGTGVTDETMERLRTLRSLRALELTQELRIGDSGLAVLRDLPSLEYLDCETRATDAGLKPISQLSNLRWLRLRLDKDRVRGPGLAELAALPRLGFLCLVGGGDQHIQYLQGLTRLKGLTLSCPDQPLTDASLAAIGRLTCLEELHVIGWNARTEFTDAGVAHLKGLKNLRKIDFGVSRIGDEGIRHLTALPNLESIMSIEATPEGMKLLTSFRNLKALDVRLMNPRKAQDPPGAATAPTNLPSVGEVLSSGVSPLAELQALEELTLYSLSLSDDDLRYLESLSHLKRLRIYGDFGNSPAVTNKGMVSICKLRQLESLALMGNRLTNSGLSQLSCLANLRSLEVQPGPKGIEPDGVTLDLSGLRSLRRLYMPGLSLHDADLACLAGLGHLQSLVLEGRISEESLTYLRDLPELKFLDIYGISCPTGEGLAYLGRLKTLESLRLNGDISDAGVYRLASLSPSVALIRIQTPKPIQGKTISHVKESLPWLLSLDIEKPPVYHRPTQDEMLSRVYQQQAKNQRLQIRTNASRRR